MAERRTLVVGSGAGGLALTLLLARSGRAVTLAECRPEIGGYLRRFERGGLRWDTGYHFSGGFDGALGQMLRVLGLPEAAEADPIGNRVILNDPGKDMFLPPGGGLPGAEAALCGAFPAESAALKQWVAAIREVWECTPMHDLRDLTPPELNFNRYDLTTVREFGAALGLSRTAELAAAAFSTCHGSPPESAPMSFHGRVSFPLWNDLSRPRGGGDRIVAGFRREAARLDVEILTGARLLRFAAPDAAGECHAAVFADGRTLAVDEVFFTMHPATLAELLPEAALTPALTRRLGRLREGTSFFCAYYTAEAGTPFTPGLISYFSGGDLEKILTGSAGYSTGYLLDVEPDRTGRAVGIVSAFRTMPPGTPPGFAATRKERLEQPEYREFKRRVTDEIAADLVAVCPGLRGRLRPAVSGSPLTCRDYDPPTGSAYGAVCVRGQARIFGRLPVRNFFFAGQNAMVPGVMGTMFTSFPVFRAAAGEAAYRKIIRKSGL